LDDAKSVLELFSETVKKTTDPDKKCMLEKLLVRITGAVEELEVAVKSNNEDRTKKAQEVQTDFKYLKSNSLTNIPLLVA
jgi:cysteinyl-tRNA synthetase